MSDTIQHGDDVSSTEEANEAVLENDLALRVQPRAPAATRYYFTEGGEWKVQKAGQSHASTVDVDSVRDTVERHIPRNDQAGGGGVRAVEKARKDRYA